MVPRLGGPSALLLVAALALPATVAPVAADRAELRPPWAEPGVYFDYEVGAVPHTCYEGYVTGYEDYEVTGNPVLRITIVAADDVGFRAQLQEEWVHEPRGFSEDCTPYVQFYSTEFESHWGSGGAKGFFRPPPIDEQWTQYDPVKLVEPVVGRTEAFASNFPYTNEQTDGGRIRYDLYTGIALIDPDTGYGGEFNRKLVATNVDWPTERCTLTIRQTFPDPDGPMPTAGTRGEATWYFEIGWTGTLPQRVLLDVALPHNDPALLGKELDVGFDFANVSMTVSPIKVIMTARTVDAPVDVYTLEVTATIPDPGAAMNEAECLARAWSELSVQEGDFAPLPKRTLEPTVTVVRLDGSASATTPAGEEVRLAEGSTVPEGATVQTGPDSTAELAVRPDGPAATPASVVVGPSSRAKVYAADASDSQFLQGAVAEPDPCSGRSFVRIAIDHGRVTFAANAAGLDPCQYKLYMERHGIELSDLKALESSSDAAGHVRAAIESDPEGKGAMYVFLLQAKARERKGPAHPLVLSDGQVVERGTGGLLEVRDVPPDEAAAGWWNEPAYAAAVVPAGSPRAGGAGDLVTGVLFVGAAVGLAGFSWTRRARTPRSKWRPAAPRVPALVGTGLLFGGLALSDWAAVDGAPPAWADGTANVGVVFLFVAAPAALAVEGVRRLRRRPCPACGAKQAAKGKFCAACGAELAPPATAP